MRTAALVLVSSALIAAGMLRTRTFLQTRNAGTGYLACAVTGVGLAILLNTPGPYHWFDQAVARSSNCSALVSHILTAVAAAAACEMVATLVEGHTRVGRTLRLVGEGAIVAAMITSFTLAAPDHEDAYFFEHHNADPHLRAYWYLFLGSVTIQLLYIASRTLHYTHHNDRWLRRGLRLIGCGSASGALFLTTRIAEVADPRSTPNTDPFAIGILVISGLLLASGVLLPQAGLLADHARSRRQLYPLWQAVTTDYPYVRVSAGRPSLYRSVIEVHDALAEARAQGQINNPILLALDKLDPRPTEEFDDAVRDLLLVTARLR